LAISRTGYRLSEVFVTPNERPGQAMAGRSNRGAGISLGGVLVIVGILIWILWSFWLGLIVALIGLIAFGGFVRGRWY
jgi:hypothetical protein